MNIVCDTNVLVSAILFGGNARNILQLASRGIVTIFVSADILREFEDVLGRPKFGLKPKQVLDIVALMRDTCDFVEPGERVDAIPDDPDDNRILEAAKSADAAFIISGDKHVLELHEWEGIQVLSPADFIETMIGQEGVTCS